MISKSEQNGIAKIIFENDYLMLEILPELGGKIRQITNKKNGSKNIDTIHLSINLDLKLL